MVQGTGTPDATLLPVGGDDYHLAYLFKAFGQGPEAGGGYAVVVGDQYLQGRGCSVFRGGECGKSLA